MGVTCDRRVSAQKHAEVHAIEEQPDRLIN
jgi:hypothetical protein